MAASAVVPQHWQSPLPDASKYIRLIRLSDQLDHADEICLRSEIVLLSAGIGYYALSYTWEYPILADADIENLPNYEDCLAITCDNKEIPVKRNLYEGLKEIVVQFPGSLLWIDALCIDQTNDQELKAQLFIMGDIYSNAMTVLVWLGKDFWNSMSDIHTLLQSIPETPNRIKADGAKEAVHTFTKGIVHLFTINARSWFRRKWTFQEIVLAKKEIILCGSFRFSLEQLRETLLLCEDLELIRAMPMTQAGSVIRSQIWNSVLLKRLLNIEEMRALLHKAPLQNSRMTAYLDFVCGDRGFWSCMMLLISASSPRAATKPHDTFLSLVGLCKILSGAEDEEVTSYSLSGLGGFFSLTARLARDIPFLSFLSYADCYQEDNLEHPTWLLTDFHYKENHLQPIIEKTYNQHTMFFNASLAGISVSEPWKHYRFDHKNRFAIRAIRVGSIRHVKSISSEDSRSENESEDSDKRLKAMAYLGLADFVRELPPLLIVRPGVEVREALWRTLIADIGKNGCSPASIMDWTDYTLWVMHHQTNASPTTQREVEQLKGQKNLEHQDVDDTMNLYMQRADVVLLQSRFPKPPPSPAPDNSENKLIEIGNEPDVERDKSNVEGHKSDVEHDKSDMEPDKPDVKEDVSHTIVQFMERQGLAFDNRIMFPDRSLIKVEGKWGNMVGWGHMIGLTDPRVAIEDEVWIIQDAKVPFVLRKTDIPGQYRLIGEAYVHGIMRGEFIRMRGDDVGWQELDLR